MADKKKSTASMLKEAKQDEMTAQEEKHQANIENLKAARGDGLDSFQKYQKEETEKEIERLREEAAENRSPALGMSGNTYSPAGTVRGTEGDNANFNPEKAAQAGQDEEWDPHAGEDENTDRPGYEPMERTGDEK